MKYETGKIYHIYNRGNNSQRIFFNRENYIFFLQKIRKYLLPVSDILAYCLMSNHFHLLIHMPDTHQLATSHPMGASSHWGKPIRDAIAIILRSYTQAINTKNKWTGSLFQSRTKSKSTHEFDDSYAFTYFHYIHQSPAKSKLVKKMEDWEFSSYQDYSGKRNGSLCNKMLANELIEIPIDFKQFISQSNAVELDGFNLNI
ncbi:MAG: putative transposase [Cyclobacteriaceae bacterium]